MARRIADVNTVRTGDRDIADTIRISHEAMNTFFEIIIAGEEPDYAAAACREAFELLDRIELELSRFLPNSDISRINSIGSNQPATVSLITFEALQICKRLHAQTGGAFDPTVGNLIKCWLDKDGKLRSPSADELKHAKENTGMDLVKLNEEDFSVRVNAEDICIDMGAFGKGYGVDKIAELLREWSIDSALIHGGYSSVLAMDAPGEHPGWPVTFSHPDDRSNTLLRLELENQAVSASGLEKGQHIIDPRSGRPETAAKATWSAAKNASAGDALSTAFMIMSPEQIKSYCQNHPETAAMIITEPDSKNQSRKNILRFGFWAEK